MKISKTLLQTILIAVTAAGTTVSCSKSVDGKPQKESEKASKTDSTSVIPFNCPACGMG